MSQTHKIKTDKEVYGAIRNGKKPFEYRKNDRNYQVGDEVIHLEWDNENRVETGERIYAKITYLLKGPAYGIPEGYCVFAQQTGHQGDFFRDYENLTNKLLPEYEKKISGSMGGALIDRINYIIRHFDDTATTSINQAREFMEDVKVQFKALEIIMESLSGDGYNHGQKRLFANHVISMLRSGVDRIDQIDWNFSTRMYDRYNFFRSNSPEKSLLNKYRELKEELERLKGKCNTDDLAF